MSYPRGHVLNVSIQRADYRAGETSPDNPGPRAQEDTSLLLLTQLPPHSPLGEGLVVDVDIELGRIRSELLAQLAAYPLAAVGSKALLGRTLLGRVEIQDHVTGLPLAPLVDMSL